MLTAIEAVLARHRLGPAAGTRRLYAAFLMGLARAAILNHRPADRPEVTATRIVDVYLRGISGGARSSTRPVRRQRGAA